MNKMLFSVKLNKYILHLLETFKLNHNYIFYSEKWINTLLKCTKYLARIPMNILFAYFNELE